MKFLRFLNPISVKYSRFELYVFFSISLLLFIILILRAITVPMTHDEIGTFYQYIQTGHFWPFVDKTDGNNHFLNSLLTYFFYHLLGSSPLVLRLSNLVLAPIYFFFCFKISEHIQSKFLGWLFFGVMALSLHFIEFLALSRGYGISITFLAGSIWKVVSGIRTGNLKSFYLSLFFLFLSSMAILSVSYTYLLILLFTFVYFMFNYKNIRYTAWFKFIGFGVLPFIFLVKFSLFLRSNGAYFDGNNIGLWETTFKTFLMPLGDIGFRTINYFMLTFAGIIAITVFSNLLILFIKGKKAISYHLIFPYLLIGNIAITYVAVKILGLVYPSDRMSFYFYPLLIGTIIFGVDIAVSSMRTKASYILAIPLLYFPFHFVTAVNLNYSVWYKYCHIPKRFYNEIMLGCKQNDKQPTIAAHGLEAYVWNFYIRDNDIKASVISKEPFPNHNTDFEMIDLQYFPGWQNYYDTIDFDRISNMHLLKSKRESEMKIYATLQDIKTKGKITDEGYNIGELSVNSIREQTIAIDFDLSVQTYRSLVCGGVTISIDDSTGKNLYWDSIFLNWIGESWNGSPHNFRNNLVLDIPKEAYILKINFWNINRQEYSINGGKIEINLLLNKFVPMVSRGNHNRY